MKADSGSESEGAFAGRQALEERGDTPPLRRANLISRWIGTMLDEITFCQTRDPSW